MCVDFVGPDNFFTIVSGLNLWEKPLLCFWYYLTKGKERLSPLYLYINIYRVRHKQSKQRFRELQPAF